MGKSGNKPVGSGYNLIADPKAKKNLPNVITSFNEEGFKRYGKDFIESWKEYWSPRVRLTIFYEGEDFPFTEGMSWRPIEEVEFLRDYMESLKFPIMHGIVGDKYDIWFDARMARKSFMQVHALKKYGGKVFWIDADSVTHKHVPESFLDECLPDDKFSCFLGRDGWYHTESGFIGFNWNHPIAKDFCRHYLHTFLTGTIFANLLFGRPGWHDCVAFDTVRHVLECNDECVNLAKDLPNGTMHPFENCAPGRYMHHYKGDRKDTKQLREGDLIIARG
jgi:hypothetical protein